MCPSSRQRIWYNHFMLLSYLLLFHYRDNHSFWYRLVENLSKTEPNGAHSINNWYELDDRAQMSNWQWHYQMAHGTKVWHWNWVNGTKFTLFFIACFISDFRKIISKKWADLSFIIRLNEFKNNCSDLFIVNDMIYIYIQRLNVQYRI